MVILGIELIRERRAFVNPLKTERIADGIYFHLLTDKRFKTNRISINLFTPLEKQTAAQNAVLPSLLRKRSSEYPDMLTLNHKLQSLYGAYLGADVKKSGDFQILTLTISCLDDRFALDGEKLTKQAAELLEGILLRPALEDGLFLEEDIEVEKKSFIELLESEFNDKRTFALSKTVELLCDSKGYGCNKYGSLKTISQLNSKQVTDAYNNILRSSDIHIIFLGSGNPSYAKEVFQKSFNEISRDKTLFAKTIPFSPHDDLIRKVERYPVSQAKLVLGFSALSNTEREKMATLMASSLYGGSPISNLFLNVREKLSLCYYCASRYDRVKGIMLVDCGVEQENAKKAEDEILRQLEYIKRGDFEEERLCNIFLSIKNGITTVGDSTGALENWYLSRISEGLIRSPEEELSLLSQIGKDEVVEVAQNIKLDTVYLLTGEEAK